MNFYRLVLGFSLLASLYASATVRYVDLNSPGPAAPFTSWATAATNIQDAIDAASAGDEIVVTNGIYLGGGRAVFGTMTNRVVLDKAVSVRSVNGPQFTHIQGRRSPGTVFGPDAVRCAYLADGASLVGFTLTNGATHSSGNIVHEMSGGGVWCSSPNAIISQCVIAANHAKVQGGGAYGSTFNNCLFTGNSATNAGATYSNVLNNCTLVDNSSLLGVGGAHSAILNNCIVYFNTGQYPGNQAQCTMNYCCTTPDPASGSGNITNDPVFVDRMSGNLRLQSSSPCLNTGNNVLAPAGPDLDGNLRIYGSTVDIGAYEYQSVPAVIAPYIVMQPTNRTVSLGSEARFYVTAGGSPPLRYQWWSNTFAILDATNTTLIVANAQLSHSGTLYSVTVSNAAGGIVSSNALLTVTSAPPVAPFITGQPTNTTVFVGSIASFTVSAGGTPPLSYQWDLNGSTPAWAKYATVVLTNVQLSQAGTYFVAITNAFGFIISSNATLTVLSLPVPGTRYVDAGTANPIAPYTNWATAARTIQEAVDVALTGDTILVTNGVYATGGRVMYGLLTNRVAVDKAIAIRSVNGPQFTSIQGRQPLGGAGDTAVRCVYLAANAALSGFTLTNGGTRASGDTAREMSGGGAWCESAAARLADCVVVGNYANSAAGGVYGGALSNCVLRGNITFRGGGFATASAASLNNCLVISNLANNGAGIYDASGGSCTVNNSAVIGNTSGSGLGDAGGVWGGRLNNCTIAGNTSTYGAGGGTYQSVLNNCIVYFNSGYYSANYTGGSFTNCCTTPLPSTGNANIAFDPKFVNLAGGDVRLLATSPCINIGLNSVTPGTTDLDGNPRVYGGTVDLGAYEFQSDPVPVAPQFLTQPVSQTVFVGTNVVFTTTVSGSGPFRYQWTYQGNDVANATNATLTLMNVQLSASGDYAVTVTNVAGHITSTNAHLTVNPDPAPGIHYVNTANANPVFPYLDWAAAATNIQDAVDSAVAGDLILVTDGIYDAGGSSGYRVYVNKTLTVRSVNGPQATIIDGGMQMSCVSLSPSNSILSGFTVTNGYQGVYGGGYGYWFPGPTVTNCAVTGNNGAGISGCQVYNSVISGNAGGGASYSTLNNCLITGNTNYYGGGTLMSAMNNCTVVSNTAIYYGGGSWSTNGPINNCIIYYNNAPSNPNWGGSGYRAGPAPQSYCCTTPDPFGTSCITNPPQFVNPAAGDYRLQATSPCINAGTNAYAIGEFDLDGNPRIVGSRVDIGAYEFQNLQPALRIAPTDGGIRLSWPLWASDFQLEQVGAAPGGSGGWSNVNAIPTTTTNNENAMVLPLDGASRLYRLFKP